MWEEQVLGMSQGITLCDLIKSNLYSPIVWHSDIDWCRIRQGPCVFRSLGFIYFNLTYFSSPTTMSKLNPTAFSFVPGQRFPVSQKQPQQPPPQPIERPEQTEAPLPPPTISLNIGGTSTPPASAQIQSTYKPPPPATQMVGAEAKSAPPKPTKTDSPAPSKTFSLEKAKTDTNAIAQEVKTVADQAVVEDLYGNGSYSTRS